MKVIAIIQARTGSTRLPSKVLKKLGGKTILEHVVERVQQAKLIDEVIIATTEAENDDAICDLAESAKLNCFRGSEEDVLARFYLAAKKYSGDVIVRITSDCPVIDPHVIDRMLEVFKGEGDVIVSNAGADPSTRTYPRGLDAEIFTMAALEQAYLKAEEKYQREHVTPYIYENNKAYYYKNEIDYSKYRLTLDTPEDFELIGKIYDELYKGQHDFFLAEIVEFLEANPQLEKINMHIEQKKLKS